ncbi:MAG: oligosaccharide flippase family protein [Terriglobales bacterium]
MSTATLRLRELAASVRWLESETSTAEGRAKERHRRAALTGAVAVLAKIVAVSTSLITIPATLLYLGTERFGLWMTISSILGILSFADFGIGNGLMNSIAEVHGRQDRDAMRQAIASGCAMLAVVGLAIAAGFLALYPRIDWARVFNVRSALAASEAGPALLLFVLCFALNVPLGAMQRIQLGLQQGYYANLWQLAGSVCGLGGVLVGVHLRLALPWLVLMVSGAPVGAAAANGCVFFGFLHPELRPRACHISFGAALQLARIGGFFFFLQVMVAAVFYSDSLIIARALGAAAVADYAVVQRMFMIIPLSLAMFTAPLWPAYREALARGDVLWVRKMLLHSLAATIAAAAALSLALFWSAAFILKIWVHGKVHAGPALLAGFSVWVVFEAGGSALAMFLNGAAVIKFQVVVASTFGVACVLAKFYGARSYGVVAIPWAAIVTYSLCHVVPCLLFVPGIVRSVCASHAAAAAKG